MRDCIREFHENEVFHVFFFQKASKWVMLAAALLAFFVLVRVLAHAISPHASPNSNRPASPNSNRPASPNASRPDSPLNISKPASPRHAFAHPNSVLVSAAPPKLATWVSQYQLDSLFQLHEVPILPPTAHRTHNGSSLTFDPRKLPSLYTALNALPPSIMVIEWTRATWNPAVKPVVDPKVCDKPHAWGFVWSNIPNNPSFPPGAISKEWDLVCRPEAFHPAEPSTPVLRIEQGYVEGGPGYTPRHWTVLATVFNHEVALQLEQWLADAKLWFTPLSVPQHFSERSINSHECLVSVTGTAYPSAFGHFPLQVFPRIVRLLALTPPSCPLLISGKEQRVVSKALKMLKAHGILEKERKVIDQKKDVLYHADVLYFTDGPAMSPPNFRLLNRLASSVLGGPWQPSSILYLQRERGFRSVQPSDELALVAIMEQESGLKVEVFRPLNDLTVDIKKFGRAGLVVGPHGAAFTNIMYCPPSAVLLELGYVGFYPDYYLRMAHALDLRYYNLIVEGNYTSSLSVDFQKFRQVFRAALEASPLRKNLVTNTTKAGLLLTPRARSKASRRTTPTIPTVFDGGQ